MSIDQFNVKEQSIGTGDTFDYTFDFTIQDALHLLVIIQDNLGIQTAKFRGDDTSQLSAIVFDAVLGGGTITLLTVLPTDYVITMLLANDAPTQPSEFKDKFSLTLENIELAFDYLCCQIQRIAYLTQRSLKLSDLDDNDAIDPTLPSGFASNPGATIAISDDGTGLQYGATMGAIENAETYATEAAASAAAALISQAAAAVSAAAAAASAIAAQSGYTVSGTRTPSAPLGITAAGGITSHPVNRNLQFIQGSPGAVTISANPQILAGTILGQELLLCGVDDTNTVKLTNGNGLLLNGDCILDDGQTLALFWDGANWQEQYRR